MAVKKLSTASPALGFTLIELGVVVAIFSILALLALPSYQRHANEAKAAQVLVRIHEMALAYHDVFTRAPQYLKQPEQLSSPGFGQAPALFASLSDLYAQQQGLQFSSQLVNHSGYFDFTGQNEFAILLIQSTDKNGQGLLNALDHLTKFKHSFVNPNMLMIALVQPHESILPAALSTKPQADSQLTGKQTQLAKQLNWPPKRVPSPEQKQPQATNHQ